MVETSRLPVRLCSFRMSVKPQFSGSGANKGKSPVSRNNTQRDFPGVLNGVLAAPFNSASMRLRCGFSSTFAPETSLQTYSLSSESGWRRRFLLLLDYERSGNRRTKILQKRGRGGDGEDEKDKHASGAEANFPTLPSDSRERGRGVGTMRLVVATQTEDKPPAGASC